MNVQTKKEAEKISSHSRGFTIIEVVLVLAIAGLIFLMVFIALPALQRNQRDTARKGDVSTVASAVSSYNSNNRGDFPETGDLANYVEDVSDNTVRVIVNDTAGPQDLAAIGGTAADDSDTEGVQDGLIVITQSTKCGASTASQNLQRGSNREYTVVTKLESGNGAAFCQNS